MIFSEVDTKIWHRFKPAMPPGIKNAANGWVHAITGMTVLRSVSTMKDGSRWIHVSVAHPTILPDWNDLVRIRNIFLGEDRECYKIIPAKADYVNLHKNCLHIWHPLDGLQMMPNLQLIKNEEAI